MSQPKSVRLKSAKGFRFKTLIPNGIKGVHRGLVVMMPGSQAWSSSQIRHSAWSPCGLAWSPYKCVALWRAVYGPSATKRPLGIICEEKGISSRFGVSISSQYDLSSWKRRKTQILPSFWWHHHFFPIAMSEKALREAVSTLQYFSGILQISIGIFLIKKGYLVDIGYSCL